MIKENEKRTKRNLDGNIMKLNLRVEKSSKDKMNDA